MRTVTIKCDRCEVIMNYREPLNFSFSWRSIGETRNIDLCPNCVRSALTHLISDSTIRERLFRFIAKGD